MTTDAVALAIRPFSMLPLIYYHRSLARQGPARLEQTPSRHNSADVTGVIEKTAVEFKPPAVKPSG